METESIKIAKLKLSELSELLLVAKQTFSDAFVKDNTAENMEIYVSENFTLEKLVSEFENPNSEFYIATLNNNIIGYLKINFGEAQTDINNNQSLEIERIYVIKEFQGNKIGELLCNKAIEIAKQRKSTFVWLGVWERNIKAINFYQRNGFVAYTKHCFMLGNDNQTDIIMKTTNF